MNEIDYLRAQIALEQRHFLETVRVVAGAQPGTTGDPNSTARSAYLAFAVPRIHARLKAMHDVLRGAATASAPGREALQPMLASLASISDKYIYNSDEYIENLMYFIERYGAQLDAAARARCTVADWRRLAHLDADSVLEESRRYAELQRS
jgi:hypothetical protein